MFNAELNLSYNWIGVSNVQAKSNFFWHNHLVRDCVKQLQRGAVAYCYSEDQKSNIAKACASLKIKIVFIKTYDDDGSFICYTIRRG